MAHLPSTSPPRPTLTPPFFVAALYPFSGENTSAMSFRQGDVIEVFSMLASGWWDGVICDGAVRGWFPSNYVQVLTDEEALVARESMRGWWQGEHDTTADTTDEFTSGVLRSGSLDSGRGSTVGFDDHLEGEDLTSFSEGGGIFAEIAAAAQADNERQQHRDNFLLDAHGYAFLRRDSSASASDLTSEEDFWVPKVTTSGQLFYLNTRTGETSRDMPIDGRGDGVRIAEDEFPRDVEPGLSSGDEAWAPATSPQGVKYFVHMRTGETSWRNPSERRPAPATSASVSESNSGNHAEVRASMLSAWTDRTTTSGETASIGRTDTLRRRGSGGSSESVLDVDFAGQSVRRKGKEVALMPQDKPSSISVPTAIQLAGVDKRRSRIRRKTVAVAELLEPPPPPLIADLEQLVTNALAEMLALVGMGAFEGGGEDEPQKERDRVASLSEGVVNAIRALLHAAGVLEHIGSSAFSSATTSGSTSTPTIVGAQATADSPSTLSAEAYAALRPTTRRVSTSLSKLTLSVRAVWGVLETTDADQTLGPDDSEDPAPILAKWATVREHRFEQEKKQRAEVLTGVRDVQLAVSAFLVEFEKVIGESTASEGGPPLPRELLRAPKALQGALRTNAAALLLPGGGFGGNWRGNGFVTLPTPQSSPALPSSDPSCTLTSLSYKYPSIPITPEVAVALQSDSVGLLHDAEALASLVHALAPTTVTPANSDLSPNLADPNRIPPDSFSSLAPGFGIDQMTPHTAIASNSISTDSPPFPERLLKDASKIQRRIAHFLTSIEDIDVAASVDFELAGEAQSRPESRRDFVSASGSSSTFADSPKESDVESMLDPPTTHYGASVQEARPLLAELEIGKQALYDIAPALLASLQELYMVSPVIGAFGTLPPASGAQPLKTSPLESFVSPVRVESGSATLLEVLDDLKSAVTRLCVTVTSLGAVADIQAAAPKDLRHYSLAFRSSLFDSQTSPSTSSFADSRTQDSKKAGPSNTTHPTTLSPSSSRLSLVRTEEETEYSVHSRDSVDSDYFFSRGPKSPAALATKFGSTSWSKRSDSESSLALKDPGPRARVTSVEERAIPQATSPSRKKNLAKLFGDDAPIPSASPRKAPDWLRSDYGPDEVSFNPEGQVRGGSLNALVIAATSHEGRVDSNYLSAFLMTYRTFCEASQLLTLLIQRYMIEPPSELDDDELDEWLTKKRNPIRARVANFLKSWVRENMEHDAHNEKLLRRIKEFALVEMRREAEAQALQIIKAVDERLGGTAAPRVGNIAPGAVPSSIIPRTMRKLKFSDIDPLELARQLTIKDGALFAKITPQECLGKAWPKEFGSDAPNISAMIDMSNAVTKWVTETILAQDDLKKRANTIKHFINVADRCHSLNNYSTLIHIIAGLNSTPIHRLRRTWETVSQKSMTILGSLNNIMRPDKNYKVYREALRGVAPPCVPFLGVYLTDWTFIGDGNPDMLREKPHQINFNKRQKASELILMIKLHQSTTYNLSAVPSLATWLDGQLFPIRNKHASVDLASEDQRLYEISLAREPRERDDEKIARLLSESGFL